MRLSSSKITVLAAAAFAVAPIVCTATGPTPNNNQQPTEQQKPDEQSQNSNQQNSNRESQSNQPGDNGKMQKAPEGWALVEEDLVVLTANEPQNHFVLARQDVARNDPRGAAEELRIAAGFIRMQASRNEGNDRQKLLDSAADVRKAAHQLATANHISTQRLRQVFNQADVALACHFQHLADVEFKNGRTVLAGHDLQAAADALQAGLDWGGNSSMEAMNAIDNADAVAMQLISTAPETPEPKPQEPAAQPAGAKLTPNQEKGENQSANSSAAKIPADAGKIINDLGNVIQKYAGNTNGSAPRNAQ